MPQIGEIVGGKYRVERLLGEGGMGAVYEAVHTQIGSRVAIKFLHPGFAENTEAVERFQREAQAAAAVGHDAIIRVNDIGDCDDGSSFLVMELLEGQSLAQILESRRPLSIEQTSFIVCQVLSGLDAAHRAGIVHRDLKPDNIFLVDTGALLPGVKILDFGISRVTGLATDEEEHTRLTKTGIVLGTPAYMSPEHARGRSDVDQRSDLFSVGVILYEALTGVMPFDGMNYNAVLAAILTEDPPSPTMHAPEIHPEIEAVVEKALCKDREGRYQNAGEMFDDLIPFVDEVAVGRVIMPGGRDVAAFSVRPSPSSADHAAADTMRDSVAPPRSGLALTIGGIAALLAIVGGIVVGLSFFGGGDSPSPALDAGRERATSELAAADAAPHRSAEVDAAASDEAPHQNENVVSIELEGLPEGARVFLDDAEVPSLPLRLARGGAMRTLRIEAEGYRTLRRMVSPSADQRIDITLQPEAAVVNRQRPQSRLPRAPRAPRATPRPSPPPPEPPTKTPPRPVAEPYRPTFIDD